MNKISMHSILALWVVGLQSAAAVHLSSDDTGQVLLMPYYSVNNDYNTLGIVRNHGDQVKALKVVLREGRNGVAVLGLNVYLAPHDAWTFALVASESTRAGHAGEPSARLLSNDPSCSTPAVPPDGVELFDFGFFADAVLSSMQRVREGYIEVYEMGQLDPATGLGHAAGFNELANTPRDCEALIEAWTVPDGVWIADPSDELMPAAGDISANLTLVDVAQGTDFTYAARALADFYAPGAVLHSTDWDVPSLQDAAPVSRLWHRGEWLDHQWSAGHQAVNALLMAEGARSEYDVDGLISGKAEWAVAFPTRRFDVNQGAPQIGGPFSQAYVDGVGSCESYDLTPVGRDGLISVISILPPPPPQLCWAVTVLELSAENDINPDEPSGLLGSHNLPSRLELNSTQLSAAAGELWIRWPDSSGVVLEVENGPDIQYHGLPHLGVLFQQYQNRNAQPGVLAKYGHAVYSRPDRRIEAINP